MAKSLTRAAALRGANAANAALALDMDLLDGYVGYALRRAQITVFADFAQQLDTLGLRPGQFAVLAVIDGNSGLAQSDLATALGIKHANLVALIDDFETRGLAERVRSRLDRRSNSLRLTAEGRRVLKRAAQMQVEHEARIVKLLGTTGRDALLTQLNKLTQLEAADPSVSSDSPSHYFRSSRDR